MARKKIKTATDQRQFAMIYYDFIESKVIKGDEKMLFIALKRFADDKGNCFPSMKKLADITGYSKRKVQDLIKSLEEKGIIEKVNQQRADGGKGSNLYTLFDYAGMWKVEKCDDKEKIADSVEEARMIEILSARGYSIKKEKSFADEPTKEQKQSQKSNMFSDNNDTYKTNKSQEKYSMEQIKIFFDYDLLVFNPVYKDLGEVVIDILYDVLNTTKDTIRVNGENKPANAVVGKLMKLDYEDIQYAIDKYMAHNEPVKNTRAYLLTLLYNAREQLKLEVTNKVACDLSSASMKNE